MENLANNQNTPSSYEDALKELQEILDNLENQSISVDEISKSTQRARYLLQYCQDKIRRIEEETKQIL